MNKSSGRSAIKMGLIVAFLLPFCGIWAFLNLDSLGNAKAIAIISGLIFVFAAAYMAAFWFELSLVRKDLAAAKSQLQRGLTRGFDGVSDDMQLAWKSYLDALITDPTSGKLASRVPAEGFFTADALIEPRVNLALYRAVPNALIGFGVFFTFFGLYLALTPAIAALSTDVKDAQGALNMLLQASAAKFGSSIVALALSVVTGMWEKATYHGILAELGAFCRVVNATFPAFNFEKALLDRLGADGQAEVAETMKHAASQLGHAASGLAQLSPEAIGHQVGMVMTPVFHEIRQELEALRAIKQDNGKEILENLIRELKTEVLLPMSSQLDLSVQVTREVNEAVRTTNEAVKQLGVEIGRVAVDLKQTTDVIHQFQQKTLAELQDFAEKLESTVNQSMENGRAMLLQTAKAVGQTLQQTIDGLGQQRAAFKESADEVNRILSDGISRTHSLLLDTSKVVQDELERFRSEYQGNLTEFFDRQNRSLEEVLGRQRDGLADVVASLQQTFAQEAETRRELTKEIDQTAAQVKDSMATVFRVAQALGFTGTEKLQQLQQVAQETRSSVIHLAEHYAGLEKSLNDTLTSSQQYLAENLVKLTEHQQVFYKTADEAIGRLADEIREAAAYLTTAAEAKTQLTSAR